MTTAPAAPIRICFVAHENLLLLAPEFGERGVGGAQLQQTLLARALVRRGFDVSMVVGDYGQPNGATWDGIRTYRSFRREAGIPVLRWLHPRLTGLWRAAAEADADIYYVSCASVQVGQLAWFARRHRRKLIFKVASDGDCDPSRLPKIRYGRDKLIYRYGLRHADAILAQSARQRSNLKLHFGVDSIIAPSLSQPLSADCPFADRDIDVLWAGVVYDIKRPQLLLRLAQSMPETRMCLVGGPSAESKAFHEGIRHGAAGLANLTLQGHVPFHQIGAFFERARVLVNTSETEGFPNTYLQAWSSGAPVVAFFDPDGVIEREGLGMRVNTLEEMREAVHTLTRDEAAWSRTSDRCRAYFRAHYAEEASLRPYLATIERLAGAGATR